jgi:ParB family chromosome partitioning protein
MNRKALGRGLGALIPDAGDETRVGVVQELPLSEIERNLEQPRTRFDEETLKELAQSMRVHGVLQPVVLRRLPAGSYRLIVGERRFRAALLAGLTTIPAIVREADEREALELALVENLQREDLNPIDEAHGYEALLEVSDIGQAEIAERVGKDRSTVANAIRLLALPPDVQEMLSDGRLSAGHGRALLSLPTVEARCALAKRAADGGLSVREVEAAARGKTKRKKVIRPRRSNDPTVRDWEERLQRALGTHVRIDSMGEEGTIRIEYYSREDLERILEVLSSVGEARVA